MRGLSMGQYLRSGEKPVGMISCRFFMYGFSLFKMSTQRVGILNYNPPASRVVTHCYTQKSPFRTIIEVSSHYLRKER